MCGLPWQHPTTSLSYNYMGKNGSRTFTRVAIPSPASYSTYELRLLALYFCGPRLFLHIFLLYTLLYFFLFSYFTLLFPFILYTFFFNSHLYFFPLRSRLAHMYPHTYYSLVRTSISISGIYCKTLLHLLYFTIHENIIILVS